jgi:hypothetical protein
MSDINSALFRSRIGATNQFMVISQNNQAGAMKLYSAVSGRFRFAFMNDNGGAGGTLADVSGISAVTLVIWQGDNDYVTQVIPGPFPNIDAAQWNNGVNPTAQHVLVELTGDQLALAPGPYTLSIFGDDDILGGNDFYVECSLTVLPTGITEVFVQPNDDPTLYQALLNALIAKMGDFARKIGEPGERIALTTLTPNSLGKYGRIWLSAVWFDEETVILDQAKELIDNP